MDELERDLRHSADGLPSGPPPAALAAVAARAEREGLLDVAWARMDSPVGELTLAATPRGLVRVAYDTDDRDTVLGELARRISPRMLEAPARLEPARRELEEYFAGRRQRFEVPVDLSHLKGFTSRVLEATAAIAFGELSSYRAVARAAGSGRAVRAAGNALGSNPVPIVVPCHRVVRTGGGLGGYTGGLERKRTLLEIEGLL